jgi:hypothetical protein
MDHAVLHGAAFWSLSTLVASLIPYSILPFVSEDLRAQEEWREKCCAGFGSVSTQQFQDRPETSQDGRLRIHIETTQRLPETSQSTVSTYSAFVTSTTQISSIAKVMS